MKRQMHKGASLDWGGQGKILPWGQLAVSGDDNRCHRGEGLCSRHLVVRAQGSQRPALDRATPQQNYLAQNVNIF